MTEKINLPRPDKVIKNQRPPGGRPKGSRAAPAKSVAKYPQIVEGFLEGKTQKEIGRELGYGGDYPGQSVYQIMKHRDFQTYLAYVVSSQTQKIFTEIEQLAASESAVDRRKAVEYRIKMVNMVWPKVNLSIVEKHDVEEKRTQSRENTRKLLEILTPEQKQEYMRLLQDQLKQEE